MELSLSEMPIYTEEEVTGNFEEIADEVDNSGPVRVLSESGSTLVIMSWECFVKNFSDVLTEEEKERLEEMGEV